MAGANDCEPDFKDAGDVRPIFIGMSLFAGITAMIVLSMTVSTYWAIAGAIPVGIAGGWLATRSRLLCTMVSELVQLFFFC